MPPAPLIVSAVHLSRTFGESGVFEAGRGGAYDAWDDWERGSGAMALVSAAILAANPHDTQAWLFGVSPTSIDVFADRSRSLGSIDPFARELYTGLGCALENLMQAAPAHGLRAALTLVPTAGQPVHAARIDLEPGPGGAAPSTRPSPTAAPIAARTPQPPCPRRGSATSRTRPAWG